MYDDMMTKEYTKRYVYWVVRCQSMKFLLTGLCDSINKFWLIVEGFRIIGFVFMAEKCSCNWFELECIGKYYAKEINRMKTQMIYLNCYYELDYNMEVRIGDP